MLKADASNAQKSGNSHYGSHNSYNSGPGAHVLFLVIIYGANINALTPKETS